MITIEDLIPGYLGTISALTALISTRVYPMEIPNGAQTPLIIYTRIDTPRELTNDSAGVVGDLIHPRIQFDCIAVTQQAAQRIARQIKIAWHGKSNIVLGTTPNTIAISSYVVDDRPTPRDPQTNLFGYQVDVVIWHEEAG